MPQDLASCCIYSRKVTYIFYSSSKCTCSTFHWTTFQFQLPSKFIIMLIAFILLQKKKKNYTKHQKKQIMNWILQKIIATFTEFHNFFILIYFFRVFFYLFLPFRRLLISSCKWMLAFVFCFFFEYLDLFVIST